MSDRDSLLAEAQSLSSSIRSNVIFAHGQMTFGLGVAGGLLGSLIGAFNIERWWLAAVVAGFLAVLFVAVLFDAGRVRAETARLAGARCAIELRLNEILKEDGERSGLVWERAHLSDYHLPTSWDKLRKKLDELQPTPADSDNGSIWAMLARSLASLWKLPVTLANSAAFNKAQRSNHYIIAFGRTADLIGLWGSGDSDDPFQRL